MASLRLAHTGAKASAGSLSPSTFYGERAGVRGRPYLMFGMDRVHLAGLRGLELPNVTFGKLFRTLWDLRPFARELQQRSSK